MALFHRHPDGVLVSVSWKRSINMEQQEWVDKKSQSRPMPFDDVEIRNERQEKEVYWENVTEWGTDANGNSQPRTRQERRTRMVWKWEQLEWRKGRAVEVSGDSQDGVEWPSYTLADRERVGGQHEEYVATFETVADSGKHGKTHHGKLDEATWGALEIGARYQIELGLLGGVKNAVPTMKADPGI